jgi:hypothetical protein
MQHQTSQISRDNKRQDTALSNKNMIIIGASGSGKSAYLRDKIDFKQKRIIAWDPDEDFKLPRVRSLKVFIALCKKSGFGGIRAALTIEPTEENFEKFAQLAFALCHCKAPMTILADEIADVTRVSKASPHWGQLCRKVRKYGGVLCAITQRPQEADKTIFNQAKYKWCGALGSQSSYKTMSDEMGVSIGELKALDNIEQKQIQYWIKEGTGEAIKETMTFKRRRAPRKKT